MILFCRNPTRKQYLQPCASTKYGRKAAIIGSVSKAAQGRVVLKTSIGGERMIDLPTGELVRVFVNIKEPSSRRREM